MLKVHEKDYCQILALKETVERELFNVFGHIDSLDGQLVFFCTNSHTLLFIFQKILQINALF